MDAQFQAAWMRVQWQLHTSVSVHIRGYISTDASYDGKNSKLEGTLHITSGTNEIEQEIKRNIKIKKITSNQSIICWYNEGKGYTNTHTKINLKKNKIK